MFEIFPEDSSKNKECKQKNLFFSLTLILSNLDLEMIFLQQIFVKHKHVDNLDSS